MTPATCSRLLAIRSNSVPVRRGIVLMCIAVLAILPALAACGKKHMPEGGYPVASETGTGTAVEQIEPPRTMDRDNVPAGVDPDDVIAHITNEATGDQAWVVDKGLLHKPEVFRTQKKSPAPASPSSVPSEAKGLDIDRAKPSHACWYWAGGILLVILALAWASRQFAWVGSLLSKFTSLFSGARKFLSPLLSRLAFWRK